MTISAERASDPTGTHQYRMASETQDGKKMTYRNIECL